MENNFLQRMKTSIMKNGIISKVWDDYDANPFLEHITIPYKNKIGQQQEAMNEILNCLSDINKSILFVADTGSGKTWAMANAFKMCAPDKMLNVYLIPSKIQTIEFSKKYNIRGFVAGSSLKESDLASGSVALVYDKVKEFRQYVVEKNDILQGKTINLIIDEAHIMYEAKGYRNECINSIFDTIENIKRLGYCYNIIMLTATFETLMPLPFDKIVTFYSTCEKRNINTGIIINTHEENKETFIIKEIAKQLLSGKKVYCRLNNKKLSHKIALELFKRGIGEKFYFLNSDEKDEKDGVYNNYVLEKLLNGTTNNTENSTGVLPEFDVLFLTNMLDVGFSIECIENIREENVVPLFIVENCINIDNIEQAFSRIRFAYHERYILICNPSWEQNRLKLSDIIEKEYQKIKVIKDGYKKLYEVMIETEGIEYANKSIKNHISFLNADGTSSASSIYIHEYNGMYEFEYDKIAFYRFCREDIYMKQFLNGSLLQEELLRVLAGNVYFYKNLTKVDIEVKKETDEDRMAIFAALDAESQKEFDNSKGLVFKAYENTSLLIYYRIIRKYYDLSQSMSYMSSLTIKELSDLTKRLVKNELKKLSYSDKKALIYMANRKEIDFEYSDKVCIVTNSELYSVFKTMVNIGMDTNKIFETIVKSDGTIKETILRHQSKIVRNEYKKGLPASGRFEKEQYLIIEIIERYKGENKFLNIKKDGEIINSMIEAIRSEFGKNPSVTYIIKMIKRLYRTTQIKVNNKMVGITVGSMLK